MSESAIIGGSRAEGKPHVGRRFRLVELLVVIVIVVVLVLLLLPAIGAWREAGRRAACLKKVHELGLAMDNYASGHNNAYPRSAEIVKTAQGTNTAGGYSFLVRLLP